MVVDPAVELELFAQLYLVPSRYEIFVFASAAVGTQGNSSPSSRYQNAFVRCVPAVSLPYVNRVSKYDR